MSRKWMVIIGVVVVVVIGGALLLWANLGNVMNSAMNDPDFKKGFVAGFKTNFKKTCSDSAQAAAQGKLSAESIDTYCDCAATQMAENMSGNDLAEIMKGGTNLSPALQQQLAGIITQCREVAKPH
jgi:hypothetical protein